MTCGRILQVEQHEKLKYQVEQHGKLKYQRLPLLNWEGVTPHFEIIVNTSENWPHYSFIKQREPPKSLNTAQYFMGILSHDFRMKREPPPFDRVTKIQSGSSPTMISGWRGTPLWQGDKNTVWFISHYDFRIGCDPLTGWQKYKVVHLILWFQNEEGPPFNRVTKIQGGSSPAMISEWRGTPLWQGDKNTGWFISCYDFRMKRDPPLTGWQKYRVVHLPLWIQNEEGPPWKVVSNNNNNNNRDLSMTCRPTAAGKKGGSPYLICPLP